MGDEKWLAGVMGGRVRSGKKRVSDIRGGYHVVYDKSEGNGRIRERLVLFPQRVGFWRRFRWKTDFGEDYFNGMVRLAKLMYRERGVRMAGKQWEGKGRAVEIRRELDLMDRYGILWWWYLQHGPRDVGRYRVEGIRGKRGQNKWWVLSDIMFDRYVRGKGVDKYRDVDGGVWDGLVRGLKWGERGNRFYRVD